MTAAPPRRRLAFRIITVFGLLLLCFGITEAAFRMLGVHAHPVRAKRWLQDRRDPTRRYHVYPDNPHGEMQPTPPTTSGTWELFDLRQPPRPLPIERVSETPWCIEYQRNSLSWRDDEYPPAPPSGVVRIAGVGDSFAMGEGVPRELTLFERLERELAPGVEVPNCGDSGADLALQARKVRWLAANYGCQRALVVTIANDIAVGPELAARHERINDLINVRDEYVTDHERDKWWAGSSRVLHVIGAGLEMRRIARGTIQWYLDSFTREHNAEGLDAMAADFRALAAVPGCRVAVVLFPLLEDLEGGYPLQPAHDTMAQLARDAGLPVLDLAPVFAGQDTTSLHVHPADHHPNGTAHALAADAVANWLRTELPEFLEPEPR